MSLEHRLDIKAGEHLAVVARAAAGTILPVIFLETVLFTAPFFFLRPLLQWQTIGYVIISALMFLGAFLATRTFAKWYGSYLAVTDRRLVLVRREGFFAREVTELSYEKITEISFRVRGIGQTIFDRGSLLIQSFASDEPFEVKNVLHPQQIHRRILEIQREAARGPGDFGTVLQAVSHYDNPKLQALKAEIERTMKGRV